MPEGGYELGKLAASEDVLQGWVLVTDSAVATLTAARAQQGDDVEADQAGDFWVGYYVGLRLCGLKG